MDFITDVTVIFSSYFFLQQLEYRFQTLNDSWEYLLPGFLAVPEELTHSIARMTLDNIRLLHAELSDLLRKFNTDITCYWFNNNDTNEGPSNFVAIKKKFK
ncbi:hypothetical protein QTP88_013287 [Uroleucon formosanum]